MHRSNLRLLMDKQLKQLFWKNAGESLRPDGSLPAAAGMPFTLPRRPAILHQSPVFGGWSSHSLQPPFLAYSRCSVPDR